MTLCHTHRKKDPFVRFNKSIVFDSKLSLKAKGLLSIAFSRPDNWSFYKSELMKHCSDGEHSFNTGIKELEDSGYLYRTRKQNKKNGRLEGWDWHFFEEPVSEEDFKKFIRNGGFPDIGETPTSGKPTPNKNNSFTEKENNNPEGSEAPSAVVVSSQNEDLEKLNLSESLKKKIIKSHPPEKIKEAVNRVLAWEGRYGDAVAIQTVFRDWDKWGKVETKEGYEEKNMRILHKLRKHQGERKNFCVWVCDKYFEIVHGTRGYMVQVQESNFLGKLKDLFDKFGLVEDFVALESI